MSAPLWGESLGGAGYDTFMVGKWHLPEEGLQRSFKTLGPLTGGFLPSTTNGGAAYFRPAPGNTWTPTNPKWGGHWLAQTGVVVHSSERIADAAIQFLESRATSNTTPFFMYVAFNAPHDPRQAPEEYQRMYPPHRLNVPPNFLPQHPFLIEPDFRGRDEILAPYPRTREVIQTHLSEYYAILTHLDFQIGRILKALEDSGRANNTVICFTSDQGLAVGQHGLMGKQNLYDHSLRVPFILVGPGIRAGVRNDALIYMQSLFATTCDMAHIPIPSSVQFRSLMPLITGAKKELNAAIYAAFTDRQRALRTRDWKLIRTPAVGTLQLFHISHDPWEKRNLAYDPRYIDVLRSLDEQLKRAMKEVQDPMSTETWAPAWSR